jgi:hypothetical protein
LDSFEVKHCPTEQMLADFFTKPLHGNRFRKFHEVIMGHAHTDSLKLLKPAPSQERVGEHSKSENIGNGPNGQKTDVTDVTCARTQEPPKVSYADVVKRSVKFKPLESERRAANAPLTFKK